MRCYQGIDATECSCRIGDPRQHPVRTACARSMSRAVDCANDPKPISPPCRLAGKRNLDPASEAKRKLGPSLSLEGAPRKIPADRQRGRRPHSQDRQGDWWVVSMAPLMAAGPGRRSGRWRREPERSIGVPAIEEEPRLRRVVFDGTIAHKGSVEDAAKAAGRSAVVNTATGVIPLGVIMPVQEAAPGIMGLVAAWWPPSCARCRFFARCLLQAQA